MASNLGCNPDFAEKRAAGVSTLINSEWQGLGYCAFFIHTHFASISLGTGKQPHSTISTTTPAPKGLYC